MQFDFQMTSRRNLALRSKMFRKLVETMQKSLKETAVVADFNKGKEKLGTFLEDFLQPVA